MPIIPPSPRLGLLLAAFVFPFLLLPAMAEKEPIASFDFSLAVDADQTGGRVATFYAGDAPSVGQASESEGKQALSFDGTQGLVLASKGLSFGDSGFTIEAVVRMKNNPAQGSAMIVSQVGRFLLFVRPGGILSAQVQTIPDRTLLSSSGENRLLLGAWHTVELVYDGAQVILSIDGKVVAQHESPKRLAGSSNPIVIGSRFAIGGDFASGSNRLIEGLDGDLASVAIFRNEEGTSKSGE